MTDSNIPPPSPAAPACETHQAVKSGAALLRLETTRSRNGLDGAWWPRTRAIATELPTLINRPGTSGRSPAWAGTRPPGTASHPAWSSTARSCTSTRRRSVMTPSSSPAATTTTSPPRDTAADAARQAMARAVRADNITQAAQILITTTPEPESGPADAAG